MSMFLNDSEDLEDSNIEVPETPDTTQLDSFVVADSEDDSEIDEDSKLSNNASTNTDKTASLLSKKSGNIESIVLSDNEDSIGTSTKGETEEISKISEDDNTNKSEDGSPIKRIPKKIRRNIITSDDEEDGNEQENSNMSGENAKSNRIFDTTTSDEEEEEDKIERKIEKYAFSPKTRKSIGIGQIMSDSDSEAEETSNENSFENEPFNIPEGLSSTMMVPVNLSKSSNKSVDNEDDDLIIVEEKVQTINISDDSSSRSQLSIDLTSIPDIKPKLDNKLLMDLQLVQPKITDFTKVKVPKQVYDEQVQVLAQMEADLATQKTLYKTISKTVFDGGRKLLSKMTELKAQIEDQKKTINNMEPIGEEPEKPKSVNLSWDELEGMLKSEQPKHFGKQGIKTFETQKLLTMDKLQEIHQGLSSCPTESDLIETPTHIKVELMNHQKHALAFMKWRESQKPRGGMLADDMGLGKTLTMLSLVAMDLENQREPNEEEDESDSEDKDKSKEKKTTGWSTKGRKELYQGGTLVICPASLLQQWEGEVKSKMKRNSLEYLVYHGTNRDSRGRYLSEYDLVITTYSIASVDKKTNIGLYRVKWHRIILDEGHAIRNHKSQMSMAACELIGRRRWLLSGTPIHNKEMDMFAVLKFLRCEPFNDLTYFKKWIDNKTSSGKQRLNTLLKSIMLRRTKEQLQTRGELNSLPPKETITIEVKLDKDEMNVYQRVMIYSRTLFAQFLHQRAGKFTDRMEAANQLSNDPNSVYYNIHKKLVRMNTANEVKQFEILVLLLRLRQICCHPGLIDAMLDDNDISAMDSTGDRSEIDLLNQLDNLSLNDHSGEQQSGTTTTTKKERILTSSNPVFNLDRPSSKFKKILETINDLLDTPDKIVIVSQWSSVLDILEKYTNEKNIPTTKLTGKVNVKDRAQVVEDFNRENKGPRILFLSLTAGGVGLNLVGGNHLFLIDLHWNPQLERQAQDRIYRFGQKKPVKIYKFMVADTIEQRILTLQEHKLQIADAVLTGSTNAAGSKLTIADLKTLFDMN